MKRLTQSTVKALTNIDSCLCLVVFVGLIMALALVITLAPTLTVWAQSTTF